VVGGIALRHGFDDFVQWAGHIGFGIRPSARGRGLATWAIGQMLIETEQTMDRVLIVCAADNIASAKTIERSGGALEGIQETALGLARRYWLKTG
jgi:predicted acetyltransferase